MSWYLIAQNAEAKEIDVKKLPKSCKGGDCYCAAGHYLMDHSMMGVGANLLLVHGEVTGQGGVAGIRFGHAGIEDGDTCIDVSRGRNIQMPKVIYYAIGHIDEDKVFKYDYKALRRKVTETGHWGPWDLATRY